MLRADVTLSPLRVALQLRHTCRITPLLASSAQFHIHVGDRDRETAPARVNGDPAADRRMGRLRRLEIFDAGRQPRAQLVNRLGM
jgi:hypothetical protein